MCSDAVVFNMDPSNEKLPYEAAADISELVCAGEVAKRLELGPNGSLLYAMEYLEENFKWLDERLKKHKGKYILFDFPGQVELYTHNKCVRNIVQRLQKNGYRVSFVFLLFAECETHTVLVGTGAHAAQITAVNLVDAHYVSDPTKFISVFLMSLTQMMQLELPAVNVLSKVDLIEQYGELRTLSCDTRARSFLTF